VYSLSRRHHLRHLDKGTIFVPSLVVGVGSIYIVRLSLWVEEV